MLKKTHSYVDFDGQQRTEDFYFNLTEAELTELQYSLNGGMSQLLEKIIREQDQQKIVEYFKKIVLMSYGVKSMDGRNHVKNDAIRESFVSTNAYSDIFMELANDANKAAEFINGIMPKTKERRSPNLTAIQAAAPPLSETTATVNNITPLPGLAPIEGVITPVTN